MKPIDQGGWNVFITYGGGYDFADPAMLIALAASGKKGWFGWPENASTRHCAPNGPRPDTLRGAAGHRQEDAGRRRGTSC